MENEKLEILHDHHKDSFSYIRDREHQRDRLFLISIGLLAFLATAILFTANVGAVLRTVRVVGSQADLSQIPSAALISATWTFTLAILLRYCQVSIIIERQYVYIHELERRISKEFGDDSIYVRESRAYEDNYPRFSRWAWLFYVFVFPVLVVSIGIGLIVAEWALLPSALPFKLIDTLILAALCTTLILYRLLPQRGRTRDATAATPPDPPKSPQHPFHNDV